ncbi:MAG: transcriptional regulator [Hyphomonadaceae bacterium]|nr:MAG: transcriptional regulator [Hyphomonadaceae bacterium]KAF0184744.1 MAG: transcriptional regulator [Hyphomonadaceae bacterium]
MHAPDQFAETDIAILHRLMRENSFATIICQTANGMDAHHIAVLLGDDNVLRGHVSRANSVWKDIASPNVLAIFQGESSYISPSFYASKQIDGKAVPTWNYSAVHAHGSIEFIHDKAWLWDTLNALSNFHEQDFESPWQISDAPHEYIERMLGAIVGFEIKITALVGQFKLSQNKSEADREGVRTGLIKLGKNPDNLVR